MCRRYDTSVTTGSPSFEPLNGVTKGNFIARSGLGILTVASCDSLDQINGSWAFICSNALVRMIAFEYDVRNRISRSN
jgi:hypothetical protein